MKLVASLLVHNELGRYLQPCVEHLLTFCDEVRVVDDGSTDGSCEWLCDRPGVALLAGGPPLFFKHEGACRQELLDWTLEGEPTHVLTIDADEFVSHGPALREALRRQPDHPVWTLTMREVWDCDEKALWTREDGGWRAHEVPAVWKAPRHLDDTWSIRDRALACGREPVAIRAEMSRATPLRIDILHFGWADLSDRRRRYNRYAVADGGRFHASSHLQSILWPNDRVQLQPLSWPKGLPRREVLQRAGRLAA